MFDLAKTVPQEALRALKDYGDPEPLALLLEAGDHAVLDVPELRDLLARAVRTGPVKGQGNKSSPAKQALKMRAVHALAVLQGLGLEVDKTSAACGIVGGLINRAPYTVYDYWKGEGKQGCLATYWAQRYIGETLREEGTADDVVRYLAPFATSGRNWEDGLRDHLKVVFPAK